VSITFVKISNSVFIIVSIAVVVVLFCVCLSVFIVIPVQGVIGFRFVGVFDFVWTWTCPLYTETFVFQDM